MELSPLAQLGRHYLETYYPSDFDEQAFGAALTALREAFQFDQRAIEVPRLATEYQLPSEVVENAALLYYLSLVAHEIHVAYPAAEAVVLDMGGGPTIYQHIPFSLVVRNIIHAEPREENRTEIQLFLENHQDAYDWRGYFRVLLKEYEHNPAFAALKEVLVKHGIESVGAWQERVREKMRGGLVSADVFAPMLESEGSTALGDALASLGVDQCEVVTSHFLLESATDDAEEWQRGLDSLTAKVKQGGFFSMMAIRHAEWYRSGNDRVPAYSVDETFLREELGKRGFRAVLTRVLDGSDKQGFGYDGMVFMLVRKDVA